MNKFFKMFIKYFNTRKYNLIHVKIILIHVKMTLIHVKLILLYVKGLN